MKRSDRNTLLARVKRAWEEFAEHSYVCFACESGGGPWAPRNALCSTGRELYAAHERLLKQFWKAR